MIRRIVVNTSTNMVQLIVFLSVTFVMTPIYVRMMGSHDYGLREMILAMIGYMGLLDLGMQPTVSRFVALHNANGERHSLLIVYATSMVFMGAVGILLAVLFWLSALFYPEIMAPEVGEDVEKYTHFLLFVGAGVMFSFPRSVLESYLEGLQRYYIKNFLNIISTILLAVLSYIYMTPENALVLFTCLTVVFTVLRLVILYAILRAPGFGAIYLDLRLFSWAKLKELLNFGVKSCIQGAASTVEKMSDRLVIGFILGPASVPPYAISYTLVSTINTITMTLTHVFMPLFSDLSPRGEQQKILKIYMFASKLIVGLVVVPMVVGINLIGGPFIHIWMNGAFEQATVEAIIALISVYIAVPKLNPFVSRYLTAINQHGIFAVVAPFAALINLALSVVLVMKYGIIGAAMGSVLPVFVVTPIFLAHACRHLGVTMRYYIEKTLIPPLLPVLLMAGIVLWIRLGWGLNSYTDILTAVFAGAVVYAGTFWLFSLDRQERLWLLEFFRFGRKKR